MCDCVTSGKVDEQLHKNVELATRGLCLHCAEVTDKCSTVTNDLGRRATERAIGVNLGLTTSTSLIRKLEAVWRSDTK